MLKIIDKYSIEDTLVANPTEIGNCSACCFRNYRQACYKMYCQDQDGQTVFWTLKHGTMFDIPTLWQDYIKHHPNVAKMCNEKIIAAYYSKNK